MAFAEPLTRWAAKEEVAGAATPVQSREKKKQKKKHQPSVQDFYWRQTSHMEPRRKTKQAGNQKLNATSERKMDERSLNTFPVK